MSYLTAHYPPAWDAGMKRINLIDVEKTPLLLYPTQARERGTGGKEDKVHNTEIYESTIKPCPYCGHEGHLIHWGNLWHVSPEGHMLHLEDAWYVSCERYNCNNPYFYPRETPEDAINAWNELEVNNEGQH